MTEVWALTLVQICIYFDHAVACDTVQQFERFVFVYVLCRSSWTNMKSTPCLPHYDLLDGATFRACRDVNALSSSELAAG